MFIFPRSRKTYVDISIRGRDIVLEKCVLVIKGLHNCSDEQPDDSDVPVNITYESDVNVDKVGQLEVVPSETVDV